LETSSNICYRSGTKGVGWGGILQLKSTEIHSKGYLMAKMYTCTFYHNSGLKENFLKKVSYTYYNHFEGPW